MDENEIKSMVGKQVTESEMVNLLKSAPIGISDNDVAVRGGVISFSFGPEGVIMTWAEIRNPLLKP